MGAPQDFEQTYQTQLPQHVQQELSARQERVLVVQDKPAFLIGWDFIKPYVMGPLVVFVLGCFLAGFKQRIKAWINK